MAANGYYPQANDASRMLLPANYRQLTCTYATMSG